MTIMSAKSYQISFGGKPVDERFYGDVVSLTLEESTSAAGSFTLRLVSRLQDDGSWGYVDDPNLTLFNQVSISMGFLSSDGIAGALENLLGGGSGDTGLHTVFQGYITGLRFIQGGDPRGTVVELNGLDSSVLMSLEEKIATWPDMADSDIAQQILSAYSFPVEADSTAPQHRAEDNTVVQRATDLQFVRDLARRNGLEFYFESDDSGTATAYFRAPQLDGTPQPDLSAHFGDETNLKSFSVQMSGLRPLNVKIEQVDIGSGVTNSSQAGTMSWIQLGDKPLDDLVSGALANLVTPKDAMAQTLVLGQPTSDAAELNNIAQAVRNEAAWFINATGEVNSDAYQGVLRPRRTVLIRGAGKAFSGKYYVTKVTHEVRADGSYSQNFEARRNARGVDGSEQFGGGSLGMPAPAP
jgi:phage protein D